MIEKLIEKAEVLIESLPYLRSFKDKTFVIKYGGAAMIDENLKKSVIKDLILLKFIGINPVIIHGGGPAISEQLKKINKETQFVNGLRVTDDETMDTVQQVLVGKVNQEIVSYINLLGGKGIGISGKDGDTILAKKKLPQLNYDSEAHKADNVDLGFVGEVDHINEELINILSSNGYIPVISPIGVGLDGESYNINADEVAAAVAEKLNADKLILLTDVDGIYEDKNKPSTKIASLTIDKAKRMIEDGQIAGGMIPKVTACMDCVQSGVKRTHIIDGRQQHSILLEIFTDKGIGTMVVGG